MQIKKTKNCLMVFIAATMFSLTMIVNAQSITHGHPSQERESADITIHEHHHGDDGPRVRVSNQGRYYHKGRYYNYFNNGQYYLYLHNGSYYNDCREIPGHWSRRHWISPTLICK